ncbi:S26 family signal peptidase [Acidovorax sp. BoFeN1]|uniref:S26 family signal peptidase n=1 Tax=Acidovorax sp. BoFeN1 TaxID=1231053 RepID=UPI000E09DF20|nr:S26 family signal peptidase [Acidovorax sp. BoFeN1]RDD95227.1 S26 family signal peptidase [Acidovorax sp. BoFeN1]
MKPIMATAPRRTLMLACMGLGLAALCAPAVAPVPVRIVYNASDSVARGWYRVGRIEGVASLHVGSIVLARLPSEVAAFAAQRGYLPEGVPILKRIGAVAPQSMCVRDHVVRIDGAAVAMVRTHDGAHRPLPAWAPCRPLAEGELFLLSDTNPASFDSRYFGPVSASAVLGIAQPLWTWSAP